ncbi:hypothetical protein QUF63_16165 [Anaerolineales bacterium HSG25]|nr:hypothetical protein [Anaerolineales bacterium HSG25]
MASANTPNQKLTRQINKALEQAHQHGLLDESLRHEMFPALSEHLAPHVERYMVKYDMFPDGKAFRALVSNFNQDGPLVLALMDYHNPRAGELWMQLHQKLETQAQRSFPQLSPVYQDKLVGETYVRVYRYLPKYLFQARLNTWIFTILKNEFLRLKEKMAREQAQTVSLDDPLGEDGLTRGDRIPSDAATPDELTAQGQALADFWAQVERLGKQSGVELLKLHASGYKLKEIQQQLGDNSPVLSTIQRRIQRLIKKIEQDETMNEIARRLGVMLFLKALA